MIIVNVELTELAKAWSDLYNFLPTFASEFDAGADLRACIEDSIIIPPLSSALIPTGIKVFFSTPYAEMQIRPRSGLAAKHNITVLNTPGTVDYLYREEVKIILYNAHSNKSYVVNPGDKIAQACLREVPKVIYNLGEVPITGRGGFGSTGI